MSAIKATVEASHHVRVPDSWNQLTESIIGAAMEVHSMLGPGLAEKIYEEAMCHELTLRGIPFERQRTIRLEYKSLPLPEQRLDLLVQDLVVVELKAIERVPEAHLATLVGYLYAAEAPLGLLINFHAARLKDGIHRKINPSAVRARLF
jgi:GxxExxY protein